MYKAQRSPEEANSSIIVTLPGFAGMVTEMAKRRVTSTKRQREQVKRDKQQRKAERRANRKAQEPSSDVEVLPTVEN